MRDEQGHLALGKFGETLEDFKFAAGVEGRGGFVEDEELGVAEVSTGERDLLPLASGKFDAAFETAAKHLVIATLQLVDNRIGKALVSGEFDLSVGIGGFHSTDGNVFLGGHLEAHEILKDDANLTMQVGQLVLAEIDAVEEDLAFGGVVEAGDELDDSGLALAVLADEGDAFAGRKSEIEVREDVASGSGVSE